MNPIPLVVVAGFLGAGKTTLLNRLIHHTGGRRLAVLVNDFGDINIDAELIMEHEGNTIGLSSGCVCCTIGDSLVEALVAVTRQVPLPEHIVIEASGVAEPHNIAEIARVDPALRLNGIFVVADAEQVRRQADDKYVGDVVRHQLAAADVVLLSKIDRIPEADASGVRSWLQHEMQVSRIVGSRHGDVPIDVILDVDYSAQAHDQHDPSEHHRHGDLFEHWTFAIDRSLDREALKEVLDSIPEGVLRIKGFVRIAGEPDRTNILHVVGDRWQLVEVAASSAVASTRLVFIVIKGTVSREVVAERLTRALV